MAVGSFTNDLRYAIRRLWRSPFVRALRAARVDPMAALRHE
jgi:hypothetical protein